LGIALELLRRGHQVSYAVTEHFAPPLKRLGIDARILNPIETRSAMVEIAKKNDGTYDFDTLPDTQVSSRLAKLHEDRTADSVAQLEKLYLRNEPDVVVHDDCLDIAGRTFAAKRGIAKIRHEPMYLTKNNLDNFAQDDLVIVSVPMFLNTDNDLLDDRFRCVGFIPEGRREFFAPWVSDCNNKRTIVVSATTGLLPQVEFCKLIIDAFRNQPWNIVLSAGGRHDPISRVDAEILNKLPSNFRLNQGSSTFALLENARLFIGQGQQGSPLEALYWGVPLLTIPSATHQDAHARRLEELGLGGRIGASGLSADHTRLAAISVMNNADIQSRVKWAQELIRKDNAAEMAADIVEQYIQVHA